MMNRGRAVLSAFATVTLALGLQYEAAPQLGSVLWSADMETGDLSQWSLNGWGNVYTTGNASAHASTEFAQSPSHSAQLTITTPNTPTSGVRLFHWAAPRTYPQLYYSIWYYFPQIYTPNGNARWWNVLQWKSAYAAGNDPFFTLNVGNRENGSMYFYLYNENCQCIYNQWGTNIPAAQWVRVEVFYACDGHQNGRVTIWQDGVQLFDIRNVSTKYADGDCQWSVNNYSNSLNPSTATIYVDDAAICSGGRCP